MSAAMRATTAKERAAIAIRMMRSNKSGGFSRAFDDCFEMGDGDEVVVEIARRAMRNPVVLELVKRNRGVAWSSVENAINKLGGNMNNQTKEATHTPTPWELMETKNARQDIFLRSGATPVAKVLHGFAPNDQANAAFIVKAVNSYAALLEAARYAICSDKCPHNKCQGLRDAIAKAEGR